MGKGVSSKTHSKKQLDHYANQHNPNNKQYRAEKNNQAQMKRHQKADKVKFSKIPVWAPDYIEYDD